MIACVAVLVTGCGTAASSAPAAETRTAGPSPSGESGTQVRDVATGLTTPWEVLALDDGSLLVSERDTAKIRRVEGPSVSDVITLDEVDPGGEGGLLGLALAPDTRTVYAYFTAADDNRIVAMAWDGARLGAPEVILDGIPKGGRHNGGRIIVGPDGLLYVGTGEVADTDLSQDKNSLGGKILRITAEGRPAPGNPFGNEVWSYGHRNVEGLAFDERGQLWASEFGEQTWDELNLITKGANYGWPMVEGSGQVEGLTNPKVVWTTDEASPAGLAYVDGSLWMAALRGKRVWQIPISGTEASAPRALLEGELGRVRTVTPTGDRLLIVTSNTDQFGAAADGEDRIVSIPAD